jgi:hypothetical protein
MDKLVLRRKGARLEAPTQDWADLMEGIPEGVDLNVKVTRARSIPQLGTYWRTLAFVLHNWPDTAPAQYATPEDLSDALQLSVGFSKPIALPGLIDVVYAVPRSKSFNECSQHDFNAYMDLAIRRLSEWIGYAPADVYLEHMANRKGAA